MRSTSKLAVAALVALLVVTLAACGGSGSDSSGATTTTKPKAKVEVNTDDADNPTVEYTDGDTTTEFGASLPDEWPDELAPPDTITIVSSSTSEVDGKTQLFVSGESTQPFADVYAGLRKQLADAGYEITSDLATDEGDFAGLEAVDAKVKASITVAGDPDTDKVSVLFTVTPSS